MNHNKIIRTTIWTLAIAFFLSRCVEAIQTAMPYEHKMVERDLVLSPMYRAGPAYNVVQDGVTYQMKSYGVFHIEDLDTLRGKRCHIHYLNKRAFGLLKHYRLCKLECDGKVIFDHIMYDGQEYMGTRYVRVAKDEWIEEWGDSVEIRALRKRKALRNADLKTGN